MIRDLVVLSLLLIVIFGGYAWTKLQLWDWLVEREEKDAP